MVRRLSRDHNGNELPKLLIRNTYSRHLRKAFVVI